MIRRELSPDLVSALRGHSFWKNICGDRNLQPEIRDNSITVYYKSGALLRNLGLTKGHLTASVVDRYVPFASSGDSVTLVEDDKGHLVFDRPPQAMPLADGTEDVLTSYKLRMDRIRGSGKEGDIVQAICSRAANAVVDQEITFQEAGGPRDKIDMCCFDTERRSFVFVEVKRVDDKRLLPDFGSDAPPEVLRQLRSYGDRVSSQRDALLDTYNRVVALKRELGLGNRLENIPTDSVKSLEEKPILVIGHCTLEIVESILNGTDGWGPLRAGIEEVASALILVGRGGADVNCSSRRNKLVFP